MNGKRQYKLGLRKANRKLHRDWKNMQRHSYVFQSAKADYSVADPPAEE